MTEPLIPTSLPGDLVREMRRTRSDLMVRLMERNPTMTLGELDPALDRMFEDVARTPDWWRGEEWDGEEDGEE